MSLRKVLFSLSGISRYAHSEILLHTGLQQRFCSLALNTLALLSFFYLKINHHIEIVKIGEISVTEIMSFLPNASPIDEIVVAVKFSATIMF